MNNLKLKKRNITTSNEAKKERRQGLVPGVLYGKNIGNFLFEVGELELEREFSSSGQHGFLNFNMEGHDEKALVKEVQRDPVSHKILHIDLEQVDSNEVIESEVPIQFVGEEWLNRKGEVLQKEKGVVKVYCSAEDLPKSIKIDVSKGEIGSVYRFSDLEIADEISIAEDIQTVIASISNEKKIVSEVQEQEIEEEIKEEKKE